MSTEQKHAGEIEALWKSFARVQTAIDELSRNVLRGHERQEELTVILAGYGTRIGDLEVRYRGHEEAREDVVRRISDLEKAPSDPTMREVWSKLKATNDGNQIHAEEIDSLWKSYAKVQTGLDRLVNLCQHQGEIINDLLERAGIRHTGWSEDGSVRFRNPDEKVERLEPEVRQLIQTVTDLASEVKDLRNDVRMLELQKELAEPEPVEQRPNVFCEDCDMFISSCECGRYPKQPRERIEKRIGEIIGNWVGPKSTQEVLVKEICDYLWDDEGL